MVSRSSLRQVSILALAALALSGSMCPLEDMVGSDDTATDTAAVEVDGVWRVETADTLTVTLRADGQVAAAQAEPKRGTVHLLDRQLSLGDFCWRADVLCPQQVLLEQTALVQLASMPQAVFTQVNARGPLAQIGDTASLQGRIDGNEIALPLPQTGQTSACELKSPSIVLATAFVEAETDDDVAVQDDTTGDEAAESSNQVSAEDVDSDDTPANRATRIEGRVTVTYGGDCVTLGGTGVLQTGDTLEVSVPFTATRQ